MTEALGVTPSQTSGPYLSIGLLRQLVPTALVDPGTLGQSGSAVACSTGPAKASPTA